MSAKTLRALCIGDKVAATPSWATEWRTPLVVVANGEDDEGRLRVSLRRQESEGEDEPTYHLSPEGDRVTCTDQHGGECGHVRNLARVGTETAARRVQLQYNAERLERPPGDNSWKKYFERRGEAP